MLEWLKLRKDKTLIEKRPPMNKSEFLDSLRRNLSGEVPVNEVESNIRFYSEYISSPTEEEELRKIQEVGDPRLIAMNIIETYKMSHKIPNGNRGTVYEESQEEVYENGRQHNEKQGQFRISSFKIKAIGILSIVIFVAFIVLLLQVLSFAVQLFLPALIIFFLVFLFVGIFRR